MDGVVKWFEQQGEIPLRPPPGLREYCPLTDDPGRPLDEHFSDGVQGVAFAIEYCDAHGWVSTRTIRCLAIDARHPACLQAYCRVRERVMTFRLDRIISIVSLRSGRMLSLDEQTALLAPYLQQAEPERSVLALNRMRGVARDGVFVLLHLAMADGTLGDEPRNVIVDYIKTELAASGRALPPAGMVELWLDNLAPQLESVIASVDRLLADKDKTARLLPWLLKLARCDDRPTEFEDSLRDLFGEVRAHFRQSHHDFPDEIRAVR
jgi:hypothetical protein